jgi:hypothetical protein
LRKIDLDELAVAVMCFTISFLAVAGTVLLILGAVGVVDFGE